jgi:DNA-binding beta-propeller fold protein YncE
MTTPRDAVQFTRESADRIAGVVRTLELTPARGAALNFEANSTYMVYVVATDSGSPALSSALGAVTILLTDVNEAPTEPNYAYSIAENSAVGTLIGSPLVGSDVDAGQTLTYTLTGSASFALGSGAAGWFDHVGTNAQFNTPRGIALDGAAGVLLIADFNSNRLRALDLSTLAVTTVAGTGAQAYGDGAQGVGALGRPVAVARGGGFTYVLDAYTLRRLDCPLPSAAPSPSPGASPSGSPAPAPPSPAPPPAPSSRGCALSGCVLLPLAGNGGVGFTNGAGATVQANYPIWGAVQPGTNNLWWADCNNMAIRETTPGGVTRTVAPAGTPDSVTFAYPAKFLPQSNRMVPGEEGVGWGGEMARGSVSTTVMASKADRRRAPVGARAVQSTAGAQGTAGLLATGSKPALPPCCSSRPATRA